MKPNKIAVTGGIGSGKTAFCDIVRGFGFPVFSCDNINRELWANESYLVGLAALFPDCLSGGTIDKTKLSQKVFSDEAARRTLEEFSHPAILKRLLTHMDACGGPAFAEVPLLFEGGYENRFDAVIALCRATEARIRAVETRDGLSRADVIARMKQQLDPSQLSAKQCIILQNDGDRDTLVLNAKKVLRALQLID